MVDSIEVSKEAPGVDNILQVSNENQIPEDNQDNKEKVSNENHIYVDNQKNEKQVLNENEIPADHQKIEEQVSNENQISSETQNNKDPSAKGVDSKTSLNNVKEPETSSPEKEDMVEATKVEKEGDSTDHEISKDETDENGVVQIEVVDTESKIVEKHASNESSLRNKPSREIVAEEVSDNSKITKAVSKSESVTKGSVNDGDEHVAEIVVESLEAHILDTSLQSDDVVVERVESFEEIEEEYVDEETTGNNEVISFIKKRTIRVPKKKIEEIEQKKSSSSEAGESLVEEEHIKKISVETESSEHDKESDDVFVDETEEVEKDTEDFKDTLVEDEAILRDSDQQTIEEMSSAEKLALDEKLEMLHQYEILTKLRSEHMALRKKNVFLNNRLIQYFKKQKMEHVFTETKDDPALEQIYLKKLMLFHETNQQMLEEKLKINTEWEAQRNINDDLAEKVKTGWEELFTRKKEIAAKLIDPKTGRTMPYDKAIEDLLNRQETQHQLISDSRLAQIKLKHRIEAKKAERQKQQAGKDFNLMDYEKLSSLKEYYMDKITERDIEIKEVNKKLVNMEDTLNQVKEQLQKKEEEMSQVEEQLQRVTQELNNKRANLNTLKVTRHKIEKNTAKIKQESGLLAYPILLNDYEEKTQLLHQLLAETEELKQSHRAAVVRIRKLRESINRRAGLYTPSTATCSVATGML